MKGVDFETGRTPTGLSGHFDYRTAARAGAEEGTVVSVHGETAEVLLRRSRLCEGCGSCCVEVDEERMLAEAVNRAGAEPGDRVLLDLPANLSVRAAYILYGVPLLAFFAGLGLGGLLGLALFKEGFNVPLSIACGLALLALTYALLSRVYRPGSRAAERYRPVIVKVLR